MPADIMTVRTNGGRPAKMNRNDAKKNIFARQPAIMDAPFVQDIPNGCCYPEGYDAMGPINPTMEGHRAPAPNSMSHAGQVYPRRLSPFGSRSGE